MEETITLEWTYTPANFFETPFEHAGDGYKLTINDGKAIATLTGSAGSPLFSRIHDELNAIFLGAQLTNHKPYTLSDYRTIRTRPDGTREIGITVGSAIDLRGSFDATVRDAHGNVKVDTRAERIRERKEFALLAAKHRDNPAIHAILKSYNTAVNDPDNELVHLYEIRDALSKKCGGEKGARTTLGIAKADWKRLGELANDAPIRQGRHRGAKVGQLRDATHAELTEARTIAKNMILAYLNHLEDNC